MSANEETKRITVRMPPERYEKLKKYADECGETVNDAVNIAVERLVKGEPAPVSEPLPPQVPAPAPAAEITQELLGLPGRVEKLEEANARLNGTVKGLAAEMKTLSKTVNNFMMAYGAITAPSPVSQWGSFTEKADFEEPAQPGGKKKKKVTSKKPVRKPKK